MLAAFAAGLGGGLLVALAMRLLETSRLAIGPLAFYGNGALIAPAVGVPVVLYAIWVRALRAPRPLAPAAAAVAGVELGFAAGAMLATGGTRPLEALASGLLGGLLFVVVPAVIGGFVVTAARAIAEFGRPSTLFGLVVVALPFMLLLPFVAMGVVAGAFVVAGTRASGGAAAWLGLLLAAVLVTASVAMPLLLV